MTAARGGKSQAAFRTISEVADELKVAQHVLRFWESKFPQVRPLKRGGGRRYYRPEDIELLREIRSLLYDEGYTIKGAQKLLRQRRAKPAPSGQAGDKTTEKTSGKATVSPVQSQLEGTHEGSAPAPAATPAAASTATADSVSPESASLPDLAAVPVDALPPDTEPSSDAVLASSDLERLRQLRSALAERRRALSSLLEEVDG